MVKLIIGFIFISSAYAKDITVLFNDKAAPVTERIKSITAFFIGTPVSIDPRGEGEGLDPDPVFSSSLFDCTTYIETVMAISVSKDIDEAKKRLTAIRYKNSEVNYFKRNHFMVSDWVPENIKNGNIVDLLPELNLEKTALKHGKKALNKTTWFLHRVVDLMDKRGKGKNEIIENLKKVPETKLQFEETDYLLAEYFRSHENDFFAKLPDITIVMFIRDIKNTPTLVTHMGFIIRKNGKFYLNHAPQMKPWIVQEIPLDDYFKEMDMHRAPIEGLLLYGIREY